MVRPKTPGELHSAFAMGARVIGGGAGIMSAAMPAEPPALGMDLGALGLHTVASDSGRVGALVRLAELQRTRLDGHNAVAAALAATATPAVRRVITVGGVLGARMHRSDLVPALAVHGARAHVVTAASPEPRWLPVLGLWDLTDPFAVLHVDLGAPGHSAFRRLAGHQTVAPALVTAAGLRRADGSLVVCLGAATPRPVLLDADQLPPAGSFLEDHRASAQYRREMAAVLVAELAEELSVVEAA
ncbi:MULTISPECIES: FAD binding domain-containing protein [Streptomyces]|uniref:FAD binding domain-containing protein n=1 Tax=Streptomyces TaxID=1883 RepID=UPI0035F2ACFF